MALSKPLGVAAIDFGTTFSGWAFSFRHDYDREPIKVFAKNWNSGENISSKTPTVLLIKPDGKTLEAFGYTAQDRYIALREAGEDRHKDYYFFSRFKMMLYKQKMITRGMMLEADNGKKLPAMLIFQLAIGYLKDDLLQEMENKLDGRMTSEDIHWTLTVPAIWSEKAKKFMREAALKAGISSHILSLVLEPESASTFCQRLPVHLSQGGDICSLPVGSTYVLIDCGGGTTDICCHRILDNHKLEEVYRADGGAVGGADVDQAFEEFMVKLFGQAVWCEFKRENGDDVLSFFRNFEIKKRDIKKDQVVFSIPAELVNLLQAKTHKSLQDAVSTAGLQCKVKILKGNKIKVSVEYFRENFYGKVIQRFCDLVSSVFSHPQIQNTKTVLLVGGFSESDLIVDAVTRLLPDKQIITIQEPSMAVVKGAVIYGHDESVVQTRIARYTYGTNRSVRFDANINDESKAYVGKDGVKRVRIFEPIVKAGQELPADVEISGGISRPAYEDQSEIGANVYAVDEEDDIPKYKDDPRCIKLGEITAPILNTSVPREDRAFELKLKFGGTEIKATWTELLTGNIVEANIDFLG